MSAEHIDLLLQYALAAASEEEFPNNSLRAVHLLKYVYLADLAYAAKHGETFTGSDWRFFHFGPWSPEVQDRIEPALRAIGADRREFETEHDTVAVSYRAKVGLLDSLDPKLPLSASRPMRRAIKEFGCDTRGLLASVYRTKPMLNAAPGDRLRFGRGAEKAPPETASVPTTRQAKKKAARLKELRERVQARLESPSSPRRVTLQPAEYSAEVAQALAAIWEAESSPEPVATSVRMHDDVWLSPARAEDDVP